MSKQKEFGIQFRRLQELVDYQMGEYFWANLSGIDSELIAYITNICDIVERNIPKDNVENEMKMAEERKANLID